MSTHIKDLTGQKFGKLTALNVIGKNKSGNYIWHCICDCGEYRNVVNSLLLNGKITACKSCSPIKRTKRIRDITGMTFGRLTALYPLNITDKKGRMYWHCKCQCGNEVDVVSYSLTSNSTKSCGCLHQEYIKSGKRTGRKTKNIIGQRFGKLVVLEKINKHQYKCQCDCGNITVVYYSNLLYGSTQSCGCLRKEQRKKLLGGKKPNDLTNKRFGKLVALYPVGKNSIGAIKWHCKCDCGEYQDVIGSLLINGQYISCKKCGHDRHFKDVTGQQFGNLTTLYRLNETDTKSHSAIWHCRCICGNEIDVPLIKLKGGSVFSCGCTNKPKNPTSLTDGRVKDLTGQRFGKLTVISDTGKSNHYGKIWLCQCDCGNTKEVDSNKLRMKSVTSCGCVRRDLTEYKSRHLEGQQFGQLTVLEYAGKNKYSQSIWKCQCNYCGNIKYAVGSYLVRGMVKSCGCLKKEHNK